MTTKDLLNWASAYFVPIVGSLVGVAGFVVAWRSLSRDKRQRRHEFLERQLREFYSPILGLCSENQAICSVEAKMAAAEGEAWRNSCEELCQSAKPEQNLERFSADRGPDFARSIEYCNKQLGERVNANYLRMVEIFRENYRLAEPETRSYFKTLFEYVTISERWGAQAVPREVLAKLDHSEHLLLPFFKHIQETHDRLRERLKRGGE